MLRDVEGLRTWGLLTSKRNMYRTPEIFSLSGRSLVSDLKLLKFWAWQDNLVAPSQLWRLRELEPFVERRLCEGLGFKVGAFYDVGLDSTTGGLS